MEEFLPVRGVRYVRARALDWVAEVGRITLMLRDVVRFLSPGLRSFGRVIQQMSAIGVGSLWLVFVVSLFTGAVAAVQAAYQFTTVVPMRYLGSVILRSVIIELGPVLTALVIGGRVGASIAAELGTMKVTEQIDELRALAVHPIDYLVVPRTLAMMVSMPLLVAECIGVGIAAGYFVAIFLLDVNGTYYVANMVRWTQMRDITMALSKAFCFALLIVFISCHKGLTSREGAVGVGRATTEAVVDASLAVLIFNFFLTMALNIIFPAGYQ